uniref:Enkurin domain-containing protein n=1 Tax=Trypanosoma congolense (strain IL3000) TaxID=1068625 RepID=G0UIT3_TRYCI|nr:conserved hypothetical protein [Trypanosoma congolense IL3000]
MSSINLTHAFFRTSLLLKFQREACFILMSNENVSNLLVPEPFLRESSLNCKYEKHIAPLPKPTYSTFYDQGKEYDGTHPRYFKQRSAVIGPLVNDTIDPKSFLRTGQGVKHFVPPIPHKKQHKRDVLDCGNTGMRAQTVENHAVKKSTGCSSKDGKPAEYPYGTVKGGDFADDGSPTDNSKECPKQLEQLQHNVINTGAGEHGDNTGDLLANGNSFADGATGGDKNFQRGLLGRPVARKDFVSSNIISAENMVPKRRKDQPENPTCRKTFGQVPGYIGRVKEQIEREQMQLKAVADSQARQQMERIAKYVYRLDEQEQQSMIRRLRAKLSEKSAELNKMPFTKDTFVHMKRRSNLEKYIKDIESALEKLEKDAIFVYNDDPRVAHWTRDAAFEEARRFASS